MGEYAAFLLILVFGFACGYGTARARGDKKGEPCTLPAPPMPEVKPVRRPRWQVSGEERGKWLEVTPNFITEEQSKRALRIDADTCRIFLHHLNEDQIDKLHLMGRLSVDTHQLRRRDDNRAQRAPEEPWQ